VHEMIYSREDKKWRAEEQGVDKERDS
jgi:hypothetical protein